jgi:MraZ protein
LDIGHIFQGHALNAVDAKGRVSVPAGFRALIEKRALANALDPDNTLMIGEHANGACLTALDAVASAELDGQLRESVADLPAAERMGALEEARVDAFGSLDSVKFDGAGRMVLSPMLRALGEIEDYAFFLGAGSSYQIWNPKKAQEAFPEGSRNRKTLAFLLKEKGIAL